MLDVVQLDFYTAFVLCCSLLNNGAPYTFVRAWCVVVVAGICEMQKVFGDLSFASQLGVGAVPLRVLLLWVMIHTPCHELVRLIGVRNPLTTASLTAMLMTLTDLTTDPLYASPKLAGHTVMKLWHWGEPALRSERRVYGVPMTNFLWWWIVGFLSTLVFEMLSKLDKAPRVVISRNRLWALMQCGGWFLNGVFFASLYDVPLGIRFTAVVGMILPATIAAVRMFYHVEWRAPPSATRAAAKPTTTSNGNSNQTQGKAKSE